MNDQTTNFSIFMMTSADDSFKTAVDDQEELNHLKGIATPHYVFGMVNTAKNMFKHENLPKGSKKPRLVKADEGVPALDISMQGGNVFDKNKIVYYNSLDEIRLHLGGGKMNTEDVQVNMLRMLQY